MSMETNLRGRLRNTSLPFSRGLSPLFEAVVNSIHSIEEAGLSSNDGKITIEILRDTQQQRLDFEVDSKKRGPEACNDIVGFKITDNGIGFSDANMKSFLTLDSDYKADQGCRGVGRLLWLKAFSRVKVRSIYKSEESQFKSRDFIFNATNGVDNETTQNVPANSKRSTTVHLENFEKKYREVSFKTTGAIANSLFEHCLWYFVREGSAPNIIIKDEDESVNLENVYDEHMVSSAVRDSILIKEKEFNLIHIKLRTNSAQSHIIAFCAGNRLVKEENLTDKVPGLYGRLNDEAGEFVYSCYVSSSFLDDNVRSERTGFDIMENPLELFAQTEISLNEIRDAVICKAADHLSEYLEENKKKGRERVNNFVAQKAPRYRPILARIPDEKLSIDPNISDKELDITLHRYLAEIEEKLLTDGHDVMCPKENENFPEYQKRLQDYLQTVEEIKKSDLANYVFHRKVILDLLEKAIERGDDGKYAREDLIHNLIMPMRHDSSEVMLDSCNLWLLDERLAFHDYLASDKTLSSMPITNCTETKEPDFFSFAVKMRKAPF